MAVFVLPPGGPDDLEEADRLAGIVPLRPLLPCQLVSVPASARPFRLGHEMAVCCDQHHPSSSAALLAAHIPQNAPRTTPVIRSPDDLEIADCTTRVVPSRTFLQPA